MNVQWQVTSIQYLTSTPGTSLSGLLNASMRTESIFENEGVARGGKSGFGQLAFSALVASA